MIFHLCKQSEEIKQFFSKDKNPLTCLTTLKQSLRFAVSREEESSFLDHKITTNADLSVQLVFTSEETKNEGNFIRDLKKLDIKVQKNKKKLPIKKQRASEIENGCISMGIIEKHIQSIEESDFEENNFSIPPKPTLTNIEFQIMTIYSKIFIGIIFFFFQFFIFFFNFFYFIFIFFFNFLVIGSRYNKYSREISQSNWIAEGKRVGKYSVEEIMIDAVKESIDFLEIKFVSAGREDMDVRMMGNGRPFILTLIEPDCLPSEEQLLKITEKINSSKIVKISNLKLRSKEEFDFLNLSAETKEKKYRCLIKTDKLVSSLDLSLLHMKEFVLKQATPIRVLNRRAKKIRFLVFFFFFNFHIFIFIFYF